MRSKKSIDETERIVADESSSEYVRLTIVRFNELQLLSAAFDCSGEAALCSGSDGNGEEFWREEVRCMVDDGSILVTGAAGGKRDRSDALSPACSSIEGFRFALWCGAMTKGRRRYEPSAPKSWSATCSNRVMWDRVVSGCSRVYFSMSPSADYLEATVTMAAVAREAGVNALVNMSQMTVSEMSIQNTTPSHQQRQHWLGEQALAWSGLPLVTIRPTMFLESFFVLPLRASATETASNCRSGGARRHRLRGLMSLR